MSVSNKILYVNCLTTESIKHIQLEIHTKEIKCAKIGCCKIREIMPGDNAWFRQQPGILDILWITVITN
jgi:hypothetical protein